MSDDEKDYDAISFLNTLQILLDMYDLENIDTIPVTELKRLIKHFRLST